MATDGVICIGRNIGANPMTDSSWEHFIEDVQAVVERAQGIVRAVSKGVGEWQGEIEDTALVLFTGADIIVITSELAWLAAIYAQQAISVFTGASMLIMANAHAAE